jgi:hypothetical protein
MNSRWTDAAEWRAAIVLLLGSLLLAVWFHGALAVADSRLEEREREFAAKSGRLPSCCAPKAGGGG